MNMERSSGVLLHPTSLPGPYGIGDIGPDAHSFIDWLAEAGFRYWQILPLGPTGFGNSPYQCHSVFAGNPNLISPQFLLRDGLILEAEIPAAATGGDRTKVDFRRVIAAKRQLVERAWARFGEGASSALHQEFDAFQTASSEWLWDYATFMALKDRNHGVSILDWEPSERSREGRDELLADLRDQAFPWAFGQWLFFRQWNELREHARQRGVGLIGDAPIFVALDSADVWAHPKLFRLDVSGAPVVVAGVPPDYFAPTGQLWGNPIYDWSEHRSTGYRWWIRRMKALLGLLDMVRMDHFRGFGGYWEIPGSALTAETGQWQPGPGQDFMDALVREVSVAPGGPDLPVIAEDLGVVTPDVRRLLVSYDLPGMRVLQFAFAGLQGEFLPHNYPTNCVAYTGTHDNDTSRGWFSAATEKEQRAALRYLRTTEAGVVRAMVSAIMDSRAALAIIPLQDVLDLGTEARMNYPGRAQGYWEWRLLPEKLTPSLAREMRRLNVASERLAER